MYDNGDLQTPWGAIIYNTQGYKAGVKSVCLAFLVISYSSRSPPHPPRSFHNLLIRPKLNPEKKRHTSNHIYKQCTQRDFYLWRIEDVMSQRICQFMFIIPGGCERWMSFLHWKVQLPVVLEGASIIACDVWWKIDLETSKRTYTVGFSCSSVENWWNLRIKYEKKVTALTNDHCV